MLGKLEVIAGKSPVIKARATNSLMPFGVISYQNLSGQVPILSRIELAESNERVLVWRAIPLGLRAGNPKDYLDTKEEYHNLGLSSNDIETILLTYPERIIEFAATVYPPQMDYAWSGYDNPLNRQIHPAILEEIASLGLERGNALDIGCGIGKLPFAIQQNYPNMRVYALDSNPSNADETKKLLGSSAVKVARAEDIGYVFESVEFDLIVSNAFLEPEVLGYGTAARNIVKLAYSQLRKGGYIILSGHTPLLTNMKALQDIGFKVLKTVVPQNLFTFHYPKQMYVAVK